MAEQRPPARLSSHPFSGTYARVCRATTTRTRLVSDASNPPQKMRPATACGPSRPVAAAVPTTSSSAGRPLAPPRARRPVAPHQGTGARHVVPHASTASTEPRPTPAAERAPTDVEYDAVVVGAGVGGLAAATQLAVAGAKVVVLER